MKFSEQFDQLLLALEIFDKEVDPIYKTTKGRFAYANLPTVMEIISPALQKSRLRIICGSECSATCRILITRLCHIPTGQYVESQLLMPQINPADVQNEAHAMGGNYTYFRRYEIYNLLMLSPEDDDGASSSKKGPISEKQLGFLMVKINQLPADRRDKAIQYILTEYNLKDLKELPWPLFNEVLEIFKAKKDGNGSNTTGADK